MPENKNIVVVDDHTMVRKGLVSLINLFPVYHVMFDACNGNDLIRQLRPDHLPEIALLDIAMPEMDGYLTAKWLSENYPSVKVLALSTMDAESAIIRMIRNGARGYVLKDSEPGELKQAFDDVISLGYHFNEQVSRAVVRSVRLISEADTDPLVKAQLTGRELEFLRLACSEKTYAEVASEMFVSERTVDGYRDSLFRKLNISSRVGLVLYAIKNGITKI